MKKFTQLLIALVLMMSSLFALDNTEFRATWVITWEHQCDSTTIRNILDNHVAANMNAVLFQVRQGGTAYYRSSFEPWGSYAGYQDPGFDPLAFAIKEAHKRGLELHAWFNTFHTSSTMDGTPAGDHPEWVCRDGNGNPMPAYRAISPGLKEVRDYTLDVIMEIVNNYDIDGMHLDYIRWNEYTTSTVLDKGGVPEERALDGHISEQQMELLKTVASPNRYLYDVEHPYSAGVPEGYDSWEDFWRSSVTEMVKSIHDSIQAVKPYVRLSTAALGKYNWGGWQGYESVYQDPALWYNENYIDQLTPMHYHWSDGNGFYYMLTGPGSSNWGYWLDDDSEVLFSVGPGSYILDENNVWNNHPSIIKESRKVSYVDGFQFFSYGTWQGHLYWEEAGATFFANKTKIRKNPMNSGDAPAAPQLTLVKNDPTEYELTIAPASTETENNWYALYRSENGSVDIDSSEIIAIKMASEPFTVVEKFDGNQNFSGEYTYAATALNRYWNESDLSNLQISDAIPSNPPVVLSVSPTEGDSIATSASIVFEFSKEIDFATVENAVSISPEGTIGSVNISNQWYNKNKVVTVNISGLDNGTLYTITLDGTLTDLTGQGLDGNYDGIGGDAYSVTYPTYDVDIRGPQILSSYPDENTTEIDPEDVFTVAFDELVDEESVNQNIQFYNGGKEISCGIFVTNIDNKSMVSIKPYSQLKSGETIDLLINTDLADTSGNKIGEAITLSAIVADYYYTENILIDDFDGDTEWWDPEGSGSTVGTIDAYTTFGFARGNYVPGYNNTKSGRINYRWDENFVGEPLLRVHAGSGPGVELHVDSSYTVQCYVYGDGSNNKFRVALYEKEGNDVAEVAAWTTIDWTGWKLVEWDLSDPNGFGEWLGNGVMDGSYYVLDGVHMGRGENSPLSGSIFVDELRIVKKSDGEQPENHAPVIEDMPNATIDQGKYLSVTVNFTDEDEVDSHEIVCLADTSDIQFNVRGHTSGSMVLIVPEDNFSGEAEISIIVKDFGIGELSDTTSFILSVNPTGIEENVVPDKFSLSQNYPNPFNPETNIRFVVPETEKVEINVYDMRGNLVRQLVNHVYHPGQYSIKFEAGNVASGVYIYQMRAGQKIFTKKMMLLK